MTSRLFARRLREQDGFSVVEGVVAAMLLVVGSLAVLGTMDAGTRNTFRAEQSQTVANRLQAELEEIKSIPYQELAMLPAAVPARSDDPDEPTSRIAEGPSGPTFALSRDGSDARPIVTADDGLLEPGPEPFQSGDVTGEIYRFVTWADATDLEMKRVTVAIKLDPSAIAFSRSYQEVHTDVVDPDATPASNPLPPGGGGGGGGGGDDAPGQFFLTDTPCSFAERQLVGPDHATHNTRGRCEQGVSTSSTRGAPDLVVNNVPGAVQEQFAYSNELSSAKGLTMRPISESSCGLSYLKVDLLGSLLDGPLDLDLNNLTGDHQKLHKWVSPPIPSGSSILLEGEGTLKIWTRSANGASHSGTICVWLFKRMPGDVLGLPIDLPVLELPNKVACPDVDQCTGGWPQEWTELAVPLGPFLATELMENERLGVAITVAGTSGNNVEFHYDHAEFDSRLEVETAAALPF